MVHTLKTFESLHPCEWDCILCMVCVYTAFLPVVYIGENPLSEPIEFSHSMRLSFLLKGLLIYLTYSYGWAELCWVSFL